MNKIGRKVIVGAAALAIAGGGYAFLDSNTVAASLAGSGSNTISGYTVGNIHYTIDTSHIGVENEHAANIASVSFVLDRQASVTNVSAVITNTGSTQVGIYGKCAVSAGFADNRHFSCLPSASEANLGVSTQLVVNAAQ